MEGGEGGGGGEGVVAKLSGGCHCGAVRFRARGPRHLVVWSCNCSICRMKGNDHFVIPKRDFELVKPATLDELGLYQFGSRQALHYFCRTCGVCAFYQPRSNPDGWAVTYGCLDSGSRRVTTHEVQHFDGENWEESIQGSSIVGMSKVAT